MNKIDEQVAESMEESQPDLRAEVRFKNAALLRAIEESFAEIAKRYRADTGSGVGVLPLIKVTAEVSGVSRGHISGWLLLKLLPYSTKTGALTKAAKLFCDALNFDPNTVFPRSLYSLGTPKLIIKEFHSEQVVSLREAARTAFFLPEGEHNVHVQERSRALEFALNACSPREALVIRRRFGIGEQEATLEEIAKDLGVHRERVRQIEQHAMRAMRHPAVSRSLREFATV